MVQNIDLSLTLGSHMLRVLLSLVFFVSTVVSGGEIYADSGAAQESLKDQSKSPVGFWKTIDDVTGEPKAIVEIQEVSGVLRGVIRKTFVKPTDKTTCDLCPGDKKDKPFVDMVILWGLSKDEEEYTGGSILDPKNGKTYKAKVALIENGEKLKVRGFIGFSLLGRTQIWHRSTQP